MSKARWKKEYKWLPREMCVEMESYRMYNFKGGSIIAYHEQVIFPIPFSSSRNCHLNETI